MLWGLPTTFLRQTPVFSLLPCTLRGLPLPPNKKGGICMRRTAKTKREPNLPKIEHVELSEHNFKMRVIGVVLLFVLGIAAIGYALFQLLSTDPGWREITPNASVGITCADELVFRYNIGASGASAGAELRQITAVYSETARKAYVTFHADLTFDGVHNPRYLSEHPNEIIEIDPLLYEAFALFERYDSRALYLAPLYVEYNELFNCSYDAEAEEYDPLYNEDMADYFARVLTFVNDPLAISLELLDQNRVILHVSDAYLAFAEEYGIGSFLDFFYMKNAFIVDYIAETLTAQGYLYGCLSSIDGYARNLGDTGILYSYNMYDNTEDGGLLIARADYTEAFSLVSMRNFLLNNTGFEMVHAYAYENGEVRTAYIDSTDGLCHSAISHLLGYSASKGCAEILLSMQPLYITDTFDADAVAALTERDIGSVYCIDRTMTDTAQHFALTILDEGYTVGR